MLFALLCLSFICLADTQTQSFIVEVEHQSESSPNQNFSIKPDPTAMPAIDMAPLLWETPSLQETPSETADTSGYPGSDSPPDNKPRRPSGLWETMTTVVESISWQALYATRDIIGYTLTLTLQKQEGSLEPITYSWMHGDSDCRRRLADKHALESRTAPVYSNASAGSKPAASACHYHFRERWR